ncbi:sensor histidine kinase [Skermanella mucosa]|uniref:sensor histidine kinase n=1 Tax=Skermanella mucosa TaxID=1789672 RepID=UPI00192C22CB|nr:sensor histidine kinase [Skermanella mucosa]UEM22695.1 sensor histidine kinase [Skermanella mucosa]
MTDLAREGTADAGGGEAFLGEFIRVIALTILPVLLFAIVVAVILTDRQQRLVLEMLESRAAAAAMELDGIFTSQIALLTTLAGSRSLDDADLSSFYVEAQRAARTQPDWFTIILSDPANGQQRLNLLRPLGAALPVFPDLDSHEQVVRTGKPMIVARPTALGPVSGRPVFGIRVPVLRDGRVIHVLSAALKPETVMRALQRLELPPGWGGVILDDKRTVVACAGCPESSIGRPALPAVREHIDEAQAGVGVLTTLSGVKSYFAIGRARASGWIVGARVPTSDMTALWLGELWIVGLAGLISIVVAFGAVARLTRRRREEHGVLEARVRERTVALELSLAQRDLLLREVYHRVKNNLQVVDSLMGFHASRLKDAEGRNALEGLRLLVHALALVHQRLMESEDLARFDIRPLLEELGASLEASTGAAERGIRVSVEADPLETSLDFAIPLGLLMTELAARALRHGYPAGWKGVVTISFRAGSSNDAALTVADDGSADGHRSAIRSDTVGSKIIRALVAQLEGEIQVMHEYGTRVTVTVPNTGVPG